MVREGKLAFCTIKELAEFLSKSFDDSKPYQTKFADCDFALTEYEYDLAEGLDAIKSGACGWYGIKKAADNGFDTECLILVCDYYGGGCAEYTQFCEDFSRVCSVSLAIQQMIIDSMSCQETCNPESTLIVEFSEEVLQTNDSDEMLEKLWCQFADVPMNPETECIEEDFLHFLAGTHREEIWHWFDKNHSKGVAYLLYEQ